MTNDPVVTNLVTFPGNIRKVVRIHDSVALIVEKQVAGKQETALWFCSPFNLSRGMGGMHYLRYVVPQSRGILDVTGMFLKSDTVIDALEAEDARQETEFNLLLVDSESTFRFLDPVRQVEFLSVNLDILNNENPFSIVGNLQKTGEFLVLVPSGCFVCRLENGTLEVLRTIWISVKSAVPFGDGYLACSNDGDVYLVTSQQVRHYIRDKHVEGLAVHEDKILLYHWIHGTSKALYKVTTHSEFYVVSPGETQNGFCGKQLFDMHDGFISIFVFPSTLLVINANDTVKRVSIHVTTSRDQSMCPNEIICGVNHSSLHVILISTDRAITVQVPLNLINE